VGTAPKPAARRAVSLTLIEGSDPAAISCVTQVKVASFAVLLPLLKQQLPRAERFSLCKIQPPN